MACTWISGTSGLLSLLPVVLCLFFVFLQVMAVCVWGKKHLGFPFFLLAVVLHLVFCVSFLCSCKKDADHCTGSAVCFHQLVSIHVIWMLIQEIVAQIASKLVQCYSQQHGMATTMTWLQLVVVVIPSYWLQHCMTFKAVWAMRPYINIRTTLMHRIFSWQSVDGDSLSCGVLLSTWCRDELQGLQSDTCGSLRSSSQPWSATTRFVPAWSLSWLHANISERSADYPTVC